MPLNWSPKVFHRWLELCHILWNLIRSVASSLFNPRAWVFFHNLSPSFLWSTSWPGTSTSYSVHFFTQSLSSFCNTCPYHCSLFHCSTGTEIMSSNPSLCLNPLLGILSCSFTPHIHLTILISAHWSATLDLKNTYSHSKNWGFWGYVPLNW